MSVGAGSCGQLWSIPDVRGEADGGEGTEIHTAVLVGGGRSQKSPPAEGLISLPFNRQRSSPRCRAEADREEVVQQRLSSPKRTTAGRPRFDLIVRHSFTLEKFRLCAKSKSAKRLTGLATIAGG